MGPAKTYPQHAAAILRLGLPLIGGHLAQIAIGLTDTIMLGWYSVDALAAVALGSTLLYGFLVFGSGFAWAVMPMVATFEAEGDDTSVRRRDTSSTRVPCCERRGHGEPAPPGIGCASIASLVARARARMLGQGVARWRRRHVRRRRSREPAATGGGR